MANKKTIGWWCGHLALLALCFAALGWSVPVAWHAVLLLLQIYTPPPEGVMIQVIGPVNLMCFVGIVCGLIVLASSWGGCRLMKKMLAKS